MSESPGHRDESMFDTDSYRAVIPQESAATIDKQAIVQWIEDLKEFLYFWHSPYEYDELYAQLVSFFPHKQQYIETELFRDVTNLLGKRLKDGESAADLADELINRLK